MGESIPQERRGARIGPTFEWLVKISPQDLRSCRIVSDMKPQRHTSRLELSFPVLVEVGGTFQRRVAVNVSEAGLLFRSPQPYAVGHRLCIVFSLPGTDVELRGSAQVRHVSWQKTEGPDQEFRIGVRFEGFEQGDYHPPMRCLPC